MEAPKEIEIPEGYEAKIEGNKVIIEPKESEDERIREAISYAICTAAHQDGTLINYVTKEKALAYLEKQKEQKPVTVVRIPKFRVGDIIQHVPLEKWDRSKKITSIDKHGYTFNLSHLGDTISGGAIGFAFEDEYELVEQKPAEWSKEDEKMLHVVLTDINYAQKHFSDSKLTPYDTKVSWLKSLSERFNLQPKQGWSKEHLSIIDYLIDLVDEHYKEPCTKGLLVNGAQCFLRNLKSNSIQLEQKWSEEEIGHLYTLARYIKSKGYKDDGEFLDGVANKLKSLCPQPHWKPSKEQMEVFEEFVLPYGTAHEKIVLNGLYNDLKKLM